MSTFVKRGVLGALSLSILITLSSFGTLANAQTPPPVSGELEGNPPSVPGANQQASDPDVPVPDENDVFDRIGYLILTLFAWFTGLAGVLLNAAVYYTVVQMASFVDNLGAIVVAWKVLRDVGNIILIFGFIAIGLATILDIQSYNAKKMLVRLIIVAVTVNFSLFAARAIIDVGNVFAYQFYEQMIQTPGGEPAEALFNPAKRGVSNAIMGMVGLQTFYSGNTLRGPGEGLGFIEFIFGALLFIVAAFVLFALAFMLIARFVILVFLMILSPIGFVGLIVPTMEGRAKEWWSYLISQSLVAPVLLLMILISVTLMTTGQGNGVFGNTGGGSFAEGFTPGSNASSWESTASMILGYLISMGLLMASLIIAKQAGAFGASFAIGASRRLTSLALSPASMIGRNTVGRGASALNKRYEQMVGNRPNALKVLRALNLDQGINKGLGAVSKDFNDRKKADKDRADHVGHAAHGTTVRNNLNAAIANMASNPGAVSGFLRGMNKTELREYLQDAESSQRMAVAASLGAKQYADLIDDDKVGSDVRHDLESGRYGQTRGAIANQAAIDLTNSQSIAGYTGNSIPQAIRDSVRALAVSDLERMSGNELLDPRLVLALSEAQAEKLTEAANNNVSAAVKASIRNIRSSRFNDDVTTRAAFASMDVKEIAGLNGDILARPHVHQSIQDASTYATVLQTAKLNTQERAVVVQHGNDVIDGRAQVPANVRAQFVARLADPTFANALGRESAPNSVYIVNRP